MPVGGASASQTVTEGLYNNSSAGSFELGLGGSASRTVPWTLPLDASARLASASLDLVGRMSTPACTTIYGYGEDLREWENFGWRIAGGGDLNGDGTADFAVTAPIVFGGGNASQSGRLDVFYGNSARAWPQGANWTYSLLSVNQFGTGAFGRTLAEGEYTGDGVADLLVAAGNETLLLFAGSPLGLPAAPTLTLRWNNTVDQGWPGPLVGGVDLNGDGWDDLLTAERLYQSPTGALGRVVILWGAPGGLNLMNATSLEENATVDFGWAISGLGDTDGDGAGEFAVGLAQNASQSGSAYVYESVLGTRTVERRWFYSSPYRAAFGVSVAGGKDLSGDGVADLAVGGSNNQSGRGAVSVFAGLGNATYADAPYLTLKGDQAAGENFGGNVELFEDMDGDGSSELAVGANAYAGADGRVYLWLMGKHNGVGQPALESIYPGDNSNMGVALERVGDVDGDGRADLAVGLPLAHNGTHRSGAVRIYYGQAHPLPENVTVLVGAAPAWSQPGQLVDHAQAAPLASALQRYVEGVLQGGGSGPLSVPLAVRFERGGILNASNLSVVYSVLRPPQGVSVTPAPAGGSLTLAWQPQVTDGTVFSIWSNKSGGNFTVIGQVPFSTTSFADTNVTNGVAYAYFVTDDEPSVGTNSTPSQVVTGVPTDIVPPAVPAGVVVAVDATAHAVRLTWNATGSDTVAFEVWRRVGTAGPYAYVRELAFPAARYDDTGLVEDATYSYIVRGRDAAGLWSDFCSAVTAHLPDLFPPQVEFGLPLTWADNLQLKINSSEVWDDDATWGAGANGTFRWSVEGPAFPTPGTFAGRDLVLLPLLPGIYRVTLEVADASGLRANRSHNVTVEDRSPPLVIVGAGGPYNEGDTVLFDASGSTDSNPASTLSYAWIATFAGGSREGTDATLVIADIPPGLLTVIVTVEDAAGNRGSKILSLVVDDAPSLTGTAAAAYPVGAVLTIQLDVADADTGDTHTYALLDAPPGLSIDGNGAITWFPRSDDYGVFALLVEVSDGKATGQWGTILNISRPANAANRPPAFTSVPLTGAAPGQSYLYNATTADPDGNIVTLVAVEGPAGLLTERFPGGLRLTWQVPAGTSENALVAVRLRASDGIKQVDQVFFIRVRTQNAAPTFAGRAVPESAAFEEGKVRRYALLPGVLSDTDDPGSALFTWSASTDNGTVIDAAVERNDRGELELVVTARGPGHGRVTLTARDPSGASANQEMEVEVSPRAPSIESPLGAGTASLLIAGAVAAIAVLTTRRRREKGETPAGGSGAAPASAGAAPPAPPAFSGASYLVESVFLLYRDGRNMFWRARPGPEKEDDPGFLGPMFVAIQDFVREALRKESDVKQLSYGEDAILVERGTFVVLAVTVFGDPPPELRETIGQCVDKIEAAYAGIIESWDGNRSRLPSVEAMLEPIWLPTEAATREEVLLSTRPHEVQVLSGLEFFQGYLRLKVAVVNSSLSVITGATLDLDFDRDVLHLDRIEPETLAHEGTKVSLGVVHTGEKKTVAYYFDPLICTSSAIDGTVRFRTAQGAAASAQMKRRQAEVVCPLFFTQEIASTAVLKRLIEAELHQYDVKAYTVTPTATREQMEALFDTLKQAVLAHDIRLVREHLMEGGDLAEAWFYGETKVSGDKFVVRAALDLAGRRAEFYAASQSISKVTGLLAEMNRTFLEGAAAGGRRLAEPVHDRKARAAYADMATVWAMIERVAK